ncbi:MAG: dTMP kinase [Candidatus Obscuribacterales bacterium]|nr:dTMP kinase [Candidatus Obscuribacterales bacterium]
MIEKVMQKAYPGSFVTLEGPEGAGKTTQVKLLAKELCELGIKHVVTRDPGGTPLGKKIRRILLSTENTVAPMAELLLYQADRAQHVEELIRPALEQGAIVFCDRYIDSTIAYQGYGRKIDLSIIEKLNQMSTGGLKPELTILFDIESGDGLSRLHPGGHDRMEKEAIEFHHRVRDGYRKLAADEPQRFHVLDASKAMSVVQEEFRRIIRSKLGRKHGFEKV